MARSPSTSTAEMDRRFMRMALGVSHRMLGRTAPNPAVGAVIAASIPPSEAENRLFGAGSEKLKEKTRQAAAEGIDKVGDLAAETAGSVAAAAAREGLDATGVQSALNKVADGVRAVADRGVDTALGKQKQPQPNQSFECPTAERNQQ